MADTAALAPEGAEALTSADIERVQEFTREPILLADETPADVLPGTARRLAVDAALKELDEGAEDPSMRWRQDFSLLLGLERVLAEDPPTLNDGATLNEHQVDALSGTLAAISTEIENPGANLNGNGRAENGNGNG